MKKKWPVTRKGWADHYIKVFNCTGSWQACDLAVWYLLMHEAEKTGDL